MKNLLLTAIVMVSFLTAKSQVVLTSAQMPSNDTQYIFYDAEAPSPPFTFSTSGSLNTWNFSTLSADSTQDDTVMLVPPSSLNGSSAFPTATHAKIKVPGEKVYSILKVDASAAYLLGGIGDVLGTGSSIAIPYETPLTVYTFPYTNTSSVSSEGLVNFKTTGAYVGQPIVDSVWIHARTFSTQQVVASGTLVLPSGSFPAILEVVRTTTYDSTMIKGSITGGVWAFAPYKPDTTYDSTYNWYTQASLLPYATVEYNDGIMDVTYFKSSLPTHVGMDKTGTTNPFAVYPNPVKDMLKIEAVGGDNVYEVYSMTGKKLLEGQLEQGTGTVSMGMFPPGIYLLHISNMTGGKMFKLIRE